MSSKKKVMDTLQETNISHSGEKEKHLQNWHFRGYVSSQEGILYEFFQASVGDIKEYLLGPNDLDRVHGPVHAGPFQILSFKESRSNSRNKKSPKTFGFNAYPMAVLVSVIGDCLKPQVVISLKKSDGFHAGPKCDLPTFKKKTPRDLHHPNVPRVFLIKSLNAFWWPGGNAGVKNILHKWCFGIWLDVI